MQKTQGQGEHSNRELYTRPRRNVCRAGMNALENKGVADFPLVNVKWLKIIFIEEDLILLVFKNLPLFREGCFFAFNSYFITS